MTSLPLLSLVISTASLCAINPSTLSIFIMVTSSILGNGKSSKRLLCLGGIFIAVLLLIFVAIGIGAGYLISLLSPPALRYLSLAIALLLITVGLFEIKEYFWYGRGPLLRVPQYFASKIHEHSARRTSAAGIVRLGALVAAVVAPAIGAAYLAVLVILSSEFGMSTLGLCTVYCLILVLPLLVILLLVVRGTKISVLTKWKEESKGAMRLFHGLLIIALAWILLLTANGTINLG